MSSKFPIGVATIERPLIILSIIYIFIFIISCTPVNLSKQDTKIIQETNISNKSVDTINEKKVIEEKENTQIKHNNSLDDVVLDKTIIALFAKNDDKKITKQFLNSFELAIYNLEIKNIKLQIEFFETKKDLKNIIENNLSPGRLFLGPVQTNHAKILNNYCNYNVIFFSFSSSSSLANDCVYLLNFFPKNELSQLLLYLKEGAKVALLYPEYEY